MKGRRYIIGGVIFIALFALNVSMAYVFYKQYNDKMDSIDRQNWLLKAKVETIEKGTDTFRDSVDKMTERLKISDEAMLDISRRTDSNDANTRESLSRLQSLRLDIEDWQKRQADAVEQIADLTSKTESLFERIDQFRKSKPANVDLGQIDIHGQGSASGIMPETEPPSSSASQTTRP